MTFSGGLLKGSHPKMDELRSDGNNYSYQATAIRFEQTINISGSEGRDTLTGTDSEDSLNGRGNDSIDGAGGNDLLKGVLEMTL